ncbi:hypothetical protein [Anoxybacteroides tepidamans]|uniref:hypothetical protein n=1 Tax=Anoxybacteroides tepidamans TaxID=265948 RepID=UPI00048561E3|nr:hypothetical protein [Anoxybacillus tepidamans]
MQRLISLFFVFIIGCTFLTSTTYAKWAYAFVVYDGNTYIMSNTRVEPKQIGKKIGRVTKYSDQEGIYSGNFSNMFPEGTEYYEIKGVKTNDAIAVKERDELFIKANYSGQYAGSKYNWQHIFLYFSIVILLFGIICTFKIRMK